MNQAMSNLDDLTLIQRFVEGKASLEANPNLRVESALDTTRLFTKRGAFLAAVKLAVDIRSVLVRQESQYCEVISQTLLEHDFMPTGVTEQGLMCYEHQPVPEGYEMKHTEARSLWKAWRTKLYPPSAQSIQPKPMIHTSQGWQRVQNISISQELLFVETLAEEVMIHSSDRIVWLSPVEEQPKTQIFAYAPLPKAQSSEAVSESLRTLSKIIEMKDGKLYVQTTQGKVVIEGSDLRFHLEANSRSSQRSDTPVA